MKIRKRCNWVNLDYKGELFKARVLLIQYAEGEGPYYAVKVETESLELPSNHENFSRTTESKSLRLRKALGLFDRSVGKVKDSPDRFVYL